MITVLCGGVGAARFLAGLVQVVAPHEITAVVNVGDDVVLHGLHISPDLDTVTYTLGGAIDTGNGWGLAGDTWTTMDALDRYGGATWFRLGDRDLATHLYRTQRRHEGAALSTVTAEIAAAWGVEVTVLPVTDDELRTKVHVPGEGEIDFQEYFVHRRHDVTVDAVRVEGAEQATPAPGVVDALNLAEVVVIAPSNPLVSIGPLLAVPGVREAVATRRDDTVAVSPIVAGAALKGPADRLLAELGHESSVRGVARLYRDLAAALVIDDADVGSADAVEDVGVRPIVTSTIMRGPAEAAALARVAIGAVP